MDRERGILNRGLRGTGGGVGGHSTGLSAPGGGGGVGGEAAAQGEECFMFSLSRMLLPDSVMD